MARRQLLSRRIGFEIVYLSLVDAGIPQNPAIGSQAALGFP